MPSELLASLHSKDSSLLHHQPEILSNQGESSDKLPTTPETENNIKPSTSCSLCSATLLTLALRRAHVKSDWHNYNLKQKLRNLPTVNEIDFEKLVGDLDESISGSDSSSSDEDEQGRVKDSALITLLKKQAKLHEERGEEYNPRRAKGPGNAPLVWFGSKILPGNTSLGFYKAIFTNAEQQNLDMVDVIRRKQLKPVTIQNKASGAAPAASVSGPKIFMCMIGGGHFAAMVVSLTPKLGKTAAGVEERQAIVIAHKTFHRYTTRRKQGGAQSANDSAKGAAHSAGAGIRRYNEFALESEVRALLSEWKAMINEADLLFVRASGTTNRRTLFGPYDDQVLMHNDPRNRTFPFNTRRATQAELLRAFVELTRVKVSQVDEAALAAAAAEAAKREELSKAVPSPAPIKVAAPRLSKEEEASLLHTSQLQALIRRSKGPAVLAYLSSNSLPPDFIFYPQTTQAHHHASTPLHLAASTNSAIVVLALLTKGGANPTVLNGEGKPPYDLTGDRATRDTFRVARSQLGEDRWDWDAAHCPPPMTKAEADQRGELERKESEKTENERRKAETERLDKEALANGTTLSRKGLIGKTLGALEVTGSDRREKEARGLTPEMRVRLERERRARAAEERIKRMTADTAGGGSGI